MPYHHPVTEEQLALFLEAAKSLMIPMNKVPPLVIEEVPVPSVSQNLTILAMNQALIAETIKLNMNNVKEYEEQKEQWYCEKAEDVYVVAKEEDTKRQAEAAVRKAEEDVKVAVKATEEDERVMDANLSEETEEVKVKRRKGEGKGKVIDTEYKRNTVPIDYVGRPGVPICKMCKGCKVLKKVWYQRPCMGNMIMDANDQIFSISEKEHTDFIMPEATNYEELQAKLKKICDEQDMFKKQKDEERMERSKKPGNSMKAGTNMKVRTNVKASGSTLKASGSTPKASGSTPKRARTITNSAGSSGSRVLSIAESLHGINKALIKTVNILGDTQAMTLCGIKLHMLKKQARNWAMEDEDEEPEELEDMEEEVEEVKEVHDKVKVVHDEIEVPHKEDKEGHKVEDNKIMKDLEVNE
ncbi:hypothetical protein M422DRAFT_264510 [Sphaerobolus stellatus SS14]|uniref:Uncharacterized protein n=1 Tax=Sphaerobolus stellatus (strain SS14) TaxID=990650 RepID=A0A0C9UFL4_SPHS4|nr:hypothetical protein M422DRAFT_264510 [Sphaerobolus stellatus SS14]